MGFSTEFYYNQTPEWRDAYVSYTQLLKQLKTAPPPRVPSEGEDSPLLLLDGEGEEAGSFFKQLEDEKLKMSKFIELQLELIRRRNMQLVKHSSSVNLLDEERDARVHKEALREMYRWVAMLLRFIELNESALRRLCSKYDKYYGSGMEGAAFMEMVDFEEPREQLLSLTQQVERWYSAYTEGDVVAAEQALNVEQRDLWHGRSLFYMGLFLGMTLILLTGCIFLMATTDVLQLDGWTNVWHTFRLMLLLTLFLWFFSFDVYVWTRTRINFAFMFGFAHERHMQSRHYLTVGSGMSAVGLIFLAAYLLQARGLLGAPFRSEYFVLMLVAVMLVFLVMPFKFWHGSARFWLFKTIGRVVCAPFFAVEFADFWMGDQLTSMVIVLYDLEMTLCYFVSDFWTGEAQCVGTTQYIRPVLAVAPLWFRFWQEIRRLRDSGRRQHLINAGKYFSGIMVVVTSTIETFVEHTTDPTEWGPARISWITCVVISTMYTSSWDLYMDWGLMRPRHGFLREKLWYPRGVYYLSMVVNVALRFSWTFTLTPLQFGVYKEWMLMLVGAGEIFRRCHWNLYRLENEQWSNVGHFRAVKDVPLPVSNVGIN